MDSNLRNYHAHAESTKKCIKLQIKVVYLNIISIRVTNDKFKLLFYLI
jgi:hypothetical protein